MGLSPQNLKKLHELRGFCAQFVRNFLEDADAGVRLTYSAP